VKFRSYILPLAALTCYAQAVITRTEVGVAVTTDQVVGKNQRTEVSRSINGQIVPMEKVDERVVREDANGKTVERLITRYDPTGNAVTPMKEIIDEQKQAGGASTTTRTLYSGDINGHLKLQERSVTQAQKSSASENSETVVERPNINGGMEATSRRSVEKVIGAPGTYQESSTTYRPDGNGGFVPTRKVSKNVTEAKGQVTENAAEYEINALGGLSLHSQTVRNVVKRPDGSEGIEVQVFGKAVPGIASTLDSSQLKMTEQQHIERRKTGSDTVVETVEVQRPTIADPGHLGPPHQISETICKGKCDADQK
jgi:hypothetical protein